MKSSNSSKPRRLSVQKDLAIATILVALFTAACASISTRNQHEPPFRDTWCEGKPALYGDDC